VIEILEYRDDDGRAPFREWLRELDGSVRARVRTRIDRMERGNFGDFKSVGGGVFELRMDFGPGYRVYFGRHGNVVVVLLCGGDKSEQRSDIERAKSFWRHWVSQLE